MANAVELATAYVSIVAETSKIAPGIKQALGAADKHADEAGKRLGGKVSGGFKGAFSSVGTAIASMGAAAAGAGAVEFMRGAIDAGSDLNETMNKASVIFGKNSGELDAWASNAAKSMGLSKGAALEAAAGFGDMFSQIGFSGDAAAKMSEQVVQMSADLGSFNNLGTDEVADKISAAFRGEYDSLQSLIPNINAARVEQVAMEISGAKSAKTLTAQQKAAAVLAIVNKDGARAMGDFANTSTGMANSQKILTAEFEDTRAKLGTKLQPLMVKLFGFISGSLVPIVETLTNFVLDNSDAILKAAGAFGALLAIQKLVTTATTAFTTAQTIASGASKVWTVTTKLLSAAWAASPIGFTITLVALLAAGLVLAYQKSETFRNIVNAAWKGVQDGASYMWEKVLKPVFRFLVSTWLTVAGAIVHGADKMFGWVPGIGDKLHAAAAVFDKFAADVNASLADVKDQTVNVGVQFKAGTRLAYDLRHQGLATGGPVFGPGTGTSDSIPAMLSNGEHVLTAREVKAAGGHDAITAWRKSLRGYATGGPVLRTSIPSRAGVNAATRMGLLDEVAQDAAALRKIFGDDFVGAGGSGGIAMGFRKQIAWAKQHVPWLTVTSTNTGGHAPNSWHYKNRAIDLAGPNMILATRIIHDAFGRSARELFHTPARAYQVKNGRPFPGVIPGHYNHIHWAMRDGGYVTGPGSSTSDQISARLSNGEYVMNAKAVKRHGVAAMDALNNGGSAGVTNNFYGDINDAKMFDRVLREQERRQRAAAFAEGVTFA